MIILSIGLPKIEITFQKLATTAVTRSARGIVALIVKDDTDQDFNLVEYAKAKEIETDKFTAENAAYIKEVLAANPNKVLVVRVDTEEAKPVEKAVAALGWRKYNWIGFADGKPADQTALVTYVKEADKKNIGAVVFNASDPDSMNIVNLTTTKGYNEKGEEVAGEKLVPRILGILAATPMTETATYKEVPGLVSVEEPAKVEDAINAGKLVLINDEGVVRIARAVNSLVKLGEDKSEDMKKIAIVEAIHIMREDITSTFKQQFLGKFKNKYDNQILFISAINSYFETLENEQILNPDYNNVSAVDVDAQRAAWVNSGRVEALEWDDTKVKVNTFRSNVYIAGNVKILDGIEDLKFAITME